MWRQLATCVLIFLLSACQNSTVKVLVGATALVAPGAQPISDSVIIISGTKVRLVGSRKDIPIPQDSERNDLRGKRVVPVDGGRIAPNEPATLLVLDNGSERIIRKMISGEWQSPH